MMLNKASAHVLTLGNDIYTSEKSPTNVYLFIVNNRNIKKRCEIFSKLRTKTPERRYVFIVNLLLTYFTVFLVFMLILKKQVLAWSHTINLKTLKLLTDEIFNRYKKS